MHVFVGYSSVYIILYRVYNYSYLIYTLWYKINVLCVIYNTWSTQ